MKKELKGFALGVICTSIAAGGLAYAKTGSEMIEAAYNNIKIYMDGVLVNAKDANGKAVEPFISNGTTYLPVRAVGEAIGKQVTWDGASSSVYLGEVPGQMTYLTDIMDAYSSNRYAKYTPENGKSFSMGGTKYTNGFVLGSYSGEASFNLNGKYKTVTFDMGHVDGTNNADGTIQIYVDNKLIDEYEVGYSDIPKTISIPVNYGLQLQFKKGSDSGYIGFGNITIQ